MRMLIALALLAAPAVASADCTVFWNPGPGDPGRVALPGGLADDAAVVVDDTRIAAVGSPADLRLEALDASEVRWAGQTCASIDLADAVLTPGLVAVDTQVGLVEVSLEQATVDDAGGRDPVRAALTVTEAYNPRSTLIPVTRIGGVTSAVVFPTGGLIAGRAGWVDLAGASQREQVVEAAVGMVGRIAGASRAEGLLRLRELLDDTRWYAAHRGSFDQGRSRELAASRIDLEALIPVVEGELPLVIEADRAADIEALLRFADEQRIRLVITGGAEAWQVADALADAEVPVVVDPLVYGPGSFDEIHARPDNAARLAEAGVDVILSSFSSHNARLVAQMAGNAVRGGMEWGDALQAVTETPARVFGMAEHGAIREGALANLVVWRSVDPELASDPFELSTSPDGVWIRGQAVPLRSRQTELLERYRRLPGTPLPPLAIE